MANEKMSVKTLSPAEILEEHLVNKFAVKPLSFAKLKSYTESKSFSMGWTFNLNFSNHANEEIRLLIRKDFPYSSPVLAFSNSDRFLLWPHVERDGTLCIFPHSTTIDSNDPIGVVNELLSSFYSYFLDASTGKLDEDFNTEYLSYWTWGGADNNARTVYSIVKPENEVKEIYSFMGQTKIVVADNPGDLIDWHARCGFGTISGASIRPAIYVKIDKPIIPPYPQTAKQFFDQLQDRNNAILPILAKVITKDWQNLPIIVSSGNGAKCGLICLTFNRPKKTGVLGRKTDQLTKGFRPGKVPQNLFISKSFGAGVTAEKSTVKRADHAWIHGRGFDSTASVLAGKNVAFIGCGSLGSGLIRLMAQSGLGNMHLFDSEHLHWENLSRHQLGARAVSQFKAEKLAKVIRMDFPHLPSINATNSDVLMGGEVSPQDLLKFDLIVSTTGSWSGDKFIADLQATVKNFPPVLYSWLETEALAAHAVLIKSGHASFLSGFDNVGAMNTPIISAAQNSAIVIPGCAGVFSPYGAITLSHAQAMIAENCVSALMDQFRNCSHTCYIERRETIAKHNHNINPNWEKQYGTPAESGGVYEFDWVLASNNLETTNTKNPQAA